MNKLLKSKIFIGKLNKSWFIDGFFFFWVAQMIWSNTTPCRALRNLHNIVLFASITQFLK